MVPLGGPTCRLQRRWLVGDPASLVRDNINLALDQLIGVFQ